MALFASAFYKYRSSGVTLFTIQSLYKVICKCLQSSDLECEFFLYMHCVPWVVFEFHVIFTSYLAIIGISFKNKSCQNCQNGKQRDCSVTSYIVRIGLYFQRQPPWLLRTPELVTLRAVWTPWISTNITSLTEQHPSFSNVQPSKRSWEINYINGFHFAEVNWPNRSLEPKKAAFMRKVCTGKEIPR